MAWQKVNAMPSSTVSTRPVTARGDRSSIAHGAPTLQSARGQQDERVEQRQAPWIERVLEEAGTDAAAGMSRLPSTDRRPVAAKTSLREVRPTRWPVLFISSCTPAGKGRVEIGPEPGDEEHHLGGDEQDHAVAQGQLNDRRLIAFVGFTDDVAATRTRRMRRVPQRQWRIAMAP